MSEAAACDRLGEAKRVLAIRLDTIGDVVMTTPALTALHDAGARVTLLTSSASLPLKPMLPYLENVIALDVPWMKPAEEALAPAAAHAAALAHLRAQAFDAAIVFNVSTQDPSCACYLAYLSGIPRIAAYVRGKYYGLASDAIRDPDPWPPRRHEVERQIDLVSALGFTPRSARLNLVPHPLDETVALLLEDLSCGPWALVHPGATAQSRHYPQRLWANVINLLQSAGVRVVLAGAPSDRPHCDAIAAACRLAPVRCDGRLTVTQLTTLLRHASVALTVNSAAAHLAAAVHTPVVTLYAGTNPQHTPWTDRSRVLRTATDCTWCLSSTCRLGEPECLSGVPPRTVAQAALDLLGRSQGTCEVPQETQRPTELRTA